MSIEERLGHEYKMATADLRKQLAAVARERDEARSVLVGTVNELDNRSEVIARLMAERDGARVKLNDMHRRAQRLEGIESKMDGLRVSFDRYVKRLFEDFREYRAGYRRRMRLVDVAMRLVDVALTNAGHPSITRGALPFHVPANERVAKLAAERDEARGSLGRATRAHADSLVEGGRLRAEIAKLKAEMMNTGKT